MLTLPFANPLQELGLVLPAIEKAGEAILEVYHQDFEVKMKGEDDPLTEADLKSNKILKEALLKTGYYVFSEEDVDNLERLNHSKVWIIDPLDGTKEFVNRNGEFVVMMGLVEKGVPILGIVYQPTTGSLYLAQKRQGAYEQTAEGWKKLKVSDISQLFPARAIVSRSHLSDKDREFLNFLGVSSFFQKGSAGIKAGEICKGVAEFYFNSSNKLKQWDTCAAACMLVEAGGKVTDLKGRELKYNIEKANHEDGVLISNGKVHDLVIGGYKKFLEK